MEMDSKLFLTLLVLSLSASISLFIKYLGESLAIAPTTINALIGILGLPLIVALALWWRGQEKI